MSEIKKLCLIPLIIIFTVGFVYLFQPFINDYLGIFFTPFFGLYEFGLLSLLIVLTSLTFMLFVTFSQNFLYAIIAAGIASATPFLFFSTNLSLILAVCFLISFTIAFFNLQIGLKSYIDFKPQSIIYPGFKMLNTLLLISLAFGYFLNTNSQIKTNGFKVPQSLVEWAVDLTLQMQGMSVKGDKHYLAQLPTLTQEQLKLLKDNPQVLEQFGVNAQDLKGITPSTESTYTSPNQSAVNVIPSLPTANLKDILMAQTGNMLDQILKPYLFAIPFVLTFMFFSYVSFLNWILSLFLSPILSLIFYILEKSGFLKFEKTMREVKKIII